MSNQAKPIKSAKMIKAIDANTDACSLANLKKSRVLRCVAWFDALNSSADREISFSRASRSRLMRDAGVKLLFASLGVEDREDLFLTHAFVWRESRRRCDALYGAVPK